MLDALDRYYIRLMRHVRLAGTRRAGAASDEPIEREFDVYRWLAQMERATARLAGTEPPNSLWQAMYPEDESTT